MASKGVTAMRINRQSAADKIKAGLEDALAFAKGDESRARIHKPASPSIVFDQEMDGRHIAEIPSVPGCIAYGSTQAEAARNVLAIWRATTAPPGDA